jgi:hypothetical protein
MLWRTHVLMHRSSKNVTVFCRRKSLYLRQFYQSLGQVMRWFLQKPLDRSRRKSGQNVSERHKKQATRTVRHYAVWEGPLHDNCAVCPVTQDMGMCWSVHLGKLVGTISEVGAHNTVEAVTLMEWTWPWWKGKSICEVHPVTGHEGPEGK